MQSAAQQQSDCMGRRCDVLTTKLVVVRGVYAAAAIGTGSWCIHANVLRRCLDRCFMQVG